MNRTISPPPYLVDVFAKPAPLTLVTDQSRDLMTLIHNKNRHAIIDQSKATLFWIAPISGAGMDCGQFSMSTGSNVGGLVSSDVPRTSGRPLNKGALLWQSRSSGSSSRLGVITWLGQTPSGHWSQTTGSGKLGGGGAGRGNKTTWGISGCPHGRLKYLQLTPSRELAETFSPSMVGSPKTAA